MKWKHLIPKPIRRGLQIYRRYSLDKRQHLLFAQKRNEPSTFPYKHTFRQTILHAETNSGKVENMRIAGAFLSEIIVQPTEILSFWRAVGNPSKSRGFFKSRNLVGGILKEDYGGGLCQVSGLVYYVALSVGLSIVERHNHSVDIYQEHERFTPLGGDATVVYGYKDLRILNNLDSSICFNIFVENHQLVCELLSEKPLPIYNLTFERSNDKHTISVLTKIQKSNHENWETLAISNYGVL